MNKGVLAVIIVIGLITCDSVYAQPAPHILWITIEDTSPHFIGCYGNQQAHTPNIDRLAREGIRFANAFSTNTVCSPSRTTIITGVRTFEAGTGHHRSEHPLPAYMHGFPYYMRQAGYHTANNQKTDYNIADEEAYIQRAWKESGRDAGWQNRRAAQPFFSVVNFNSSHQSRTMTSPYTVYQKNVLDQLPPAQHIAADAVDMPPFYRDSPEMRKQFVRVYNALRLTDNQIGELMERLERDNLADSTIIFFFADHGQGIPRGKTNGINLGYRVPFIIRFPPMYRHLSPWGTGTVTVELVSFEDLAPTMISLAGGKVPDFMKGRILIGPARSAPADHLVLSSDRSDNGIDMIRTVTDGRFLYSRNYMPFMPELRYINYMEQGEIKQLIRQDFAAGRLNRLQQSLLAARPPEFLFDTEKDVWETNNLADDPAYADILARMRGRLQEKVMRARDVMFLPEYELTRIAERGTCYAFRLDTTAYPLKEIVAAASLSGFRDEETLARQLSLLQSPLPVVRYWAILGLRAQDRKALAGHQRAITAAMQDTYPPARITAAAIAFDIFSDKAAAGLLKKYLADPQPDLALMAANYLLYVRDKEPFVPEIEALAAQKKTSGNVKRTCEDFLNSLHVNSR